MKVKREVIFLVTGIIVVLTIISLVGFYVRTGGKEILVVTTLAAIPVGFVVIATSFTLRNANRRTQLIWCVALLILLRSVQIWKPGIDYRDELRFIRITEDYFQRGQLSGYLESFPANIPFAGVFYGLYMYIWQDPESFELLAFVVYPLLVLGYYFMINEVSKLKSNLMISNPYISALMLLPFAPVFQIIPTYYWPQLFGLAVLCFSLASLLRLLSCKSGRKWAVIAIASSILLTFTHNISSALYLITILFLFLTLRDETKRNSLLVIGIITFATFVAAHLDQYSGLARNTVLMIFGSGRAAQGIEHLSFADLASAIAKGPIVTLAHTGILLVVGLLILARLYRAFKTAPHVQKRRLDSLKCFIRCLIADPIVFSFFGFSVLAFFSGVFLKGLLDPTRMVSWASLLALPRVIPSKKANALLLMAVLLALFFLLIWTVNSPWGSPFGSNPNINTTPPSS